MQETALLIEWLNLKVNLDKRDRVFIITCMFSVKGDSNPMIHAYWGLPQHSYLSISGSKIYSDRNALR